MASGVILVPIDFEEGSKRALEVARELARGLDDEIALVHVYQLPVFTYPGFEPTAVPPVLTEVSHAARRALDSYAREVGVEKSTLREGDTTTEILAAAQELGARMIVMGTHGRHGISRALIGSVAERVVRHSPIPVVTVRAPEKG